ncbi:hypothetical protein AA0483_2298 [Acetobacter syzygii NRIC 0483]|nr:hypothetical protein AA0483_2298 [Acetobacter syzygii NRIC 0483]
MRPRAGNGGGQNGGGAMAGMEAGKCMNGLYTIHCIGSVAAMYVAINKTGQNITIRDSRMIWHYGLYVVGKSNAAGHNTVRQDQMPFEFSSGGSCDGHVLLVH